MCDRLAQYPFSRAKPRWFKRVLTGPGILGSDSSRLESRDCRYQDGRIDDASRRLSFLSGQRHESSGPAAEENRISETVYRGRFDRLAKQRRGLRTFFYPRRWSMISGCGPGVPRLINPLPSFPPTPTMDSWILATTGTE